MNEDRAGLSAATGSGVNGSVVIEYPDIKKRPHGYLTVCERMLNIESATRSNAKFELSKLGLSMTDSISY